MSSDEDWDTVKNSAKKLKQDKIDFAASRPKPIPKVRRNGRSKSAEKPSLAEQFFKFLTFKQRRSLISKIYKNTGTGQIPVSGGKIEGKKRGKL